MSPSTSVVFGKRNAARQPPAPAQRGVETAPLDHAAFFAAARAEENDAAPSRAHAVPRSFTAAFLAGLVVGCALAGFDVTGESGAARVANVAQLLGVPIDTTSLVPEMILLGLFGGARAAALTVLIVHRGLATFKRTDHIAYTVGGAAASTCLAAIVFAFGHAPSHGWAIELLAGGAAGLLYRVFAGAKPVAGAV